MSEYAALTACLPRAIALRPAGTMRVPLDGENVTGVFVVQDLTSVPTFCLHLKTHPSVAGTVCSECGLVLSHVNGGVEAGPPVCNREECAQEPDAITTASAHAWLVQTVGLTDQSPEVMKQALSIFQCVYAQHVGVTGTKARALALVSILYTSRRLYGNNARNELFLIEKLKVPTRIAVGGAESVSPHRLPP